MSSTEHLIDLYPEIPPQTLQQVAGKLEEIIQLEKQKRELATEIEIRAEQPRCTGRIHNRHVYHPTGKNCLYLHHNVSDDEMTPKTRIRHSFPKRQANHLKLAIENEQRIQALASQLEKVEESLRIIVKVFSTQHPLR